MNMSNPYAVSGDVRVAALADTSERAAFIKRTYMHLGGAVVAFILLEAVLMNVVGPRLLHMMGTTPWAPLILIGAFMAVGWLARSWADSDASPQLQYAGLGLYVLAQAVILAPLMLIADRMSGPNENIPLMAGVITGIIFLGLTALTLISGADFSWMGRMLWLAGLAAIAIVICGIIFNFTLGLWFCVAVIVLAAAYILYDTSNVLHHYRTNQHVAASLALFTSVALMLSYVVRLLMYLREE